jgi:hypothetical protein
MTAPTIIILVLTALFYDIAAVYTGRVVNSHGHVIHSQKFPRQQKVRMIFNLLVRSSDIHNTVLFLLFFFLLNFSSLLAMGKIFFENENPEYYQAFSMALSAPILGWSGFVQYWRGEAPAKHRLVIRGWWAKIAGIFMMVVGFGVAIFSFIHGMVVWLR